MSDSDIFREVDEDFRREQYKKIWDRYGIYIMAAAIAVIGIVAGYQYWSYRANTIAASSGTEFMKAESLEDSGKKAEASEAFSALVNDGPAGYRTLSQFRLASGHAADGKIDDAIKIYDGLISDSNVEETLRDFAKIQAAMLLINKGDHGQIVQRVGSLADGTGPWRHSAQELLGLSSYGIGNKADAEKYYSKLVRDPAAPQSLRQRAEMMLSLLVEDVPTVKSSDEKSGTKEGTNQQSN